MNIDDSLLTTMKIHAFYHEIPWMSMYIHGLSSPISTGLSYYDFNNATITGWTKMLKCILHNSQAYTRKGCKIEEIIKIKNIIKIDKI